MYGEKTYENIMESMLARIGDDMDKREGSIIYDATAAVAYQLAQTYFLLENYLDLVFPDTSAGEFLDRFVSSFHLERKKAVKAVRYGIFDREVPEGFRFSTMGEASLVFAVRDFVKEENGEYTYLLECETPGTAGNDSSGSLIPVLYLEGLKRAELGAVKTSGTETESDDSLRERFFAKVMRPSTSGNVYDYYNWAMSCHGVGAAKVFPLSDGPGTVKVVIANEKKEAAEEALIRSVADYIETVRPIGAAVRVLSAAEQAVNVSAKVKLSAGTNLGRAQQEFEKVVEEFMRNHSFTAQEISLARIGNLLMGVSGVEDYLDLTLNGEAANVRLSDEEIAVAGAVRLEVM